MNNRKSHLPESWSNIEQEELWEKIQSFYKRTEISEISVVKTLCNEQGLLNNRFVRRFSDFYCENLYEFLKVFDHIYINPNTKFYDFKGEATFNKNFSFTKKSMKESILKYGIIQPLLANYEMDSIFITGGRHRAVVIKEMYDEDHLAESFLCILMNIKKDLNIDLWVPSCIHDVFLKHLVASDTYMEFVKVSVYDSNDAWIVFKVIEKEFDIIIEFIDNGILSTTIKASFLINRR